MKYYEGPPLGRDGKKPKKWIKRAEVLRPVQISGSLDVFNAEMGCREAITKMERAADAKDWRGVADWRKKLEARCPELREALRKSTLHPEHRRKLQFMCREMTRLLKR